MIKIPIIIIFVFDVLSYLISVHNMQFFVELGMSNSAGVKRPSPRVAIKDADVVKRIRLAGGIPLLVSNTPELCFCWETYNNVTGVTKNPYDTRRTPGGSSGGEVRKYFYNNKY